MKKILSLIGTLLICLSASFAQYVTVPDGYVSIYSVNSETELAPLAVDALAAPQVLGPASGWGTSTEYDFTSYEKLAIKITFDAADAGHQVAIRFSVGGTGTATIHIFTLPETGTTHIEELTLADYAINGEVLMGGIVFYNGAEHWSFTYDGTPASQACTIDYVALKRTSTAINDIKIKDPDAIVNVYNISGTMVRMGVKYSEATKGLKKGFYIVGKEKIYVTE